MSRAVTAAGARNRLTALYALGWSPAALAAATGIPAGVCAAPAETLAGAGQGTLDAIGAAYERLWDRPPPQRTAHERAAAEVFTQHAREAGWAPPMAWDDDQLDAGDGTPAPGWRRREGRRRVRHEDLIEDIEWLRATGYRDATAAELAVRLGRSPQAVARALTRRREVRLADVRALDQEAG